MIIGEHPILMKTRIFLKEEGNESQEILIILKMTRYNACHLLFNRNYLESVMGFYLLSTLIDLTYSCS
jgi:uncharacterized MnhB-related membrane protein